MINQTYRPIIVKKKSSLDKQEAEIVPNSDVVSFTKHDLRKTFILTLCILTLEFIIFYANLKGIVSLAH